MTALMSSAALHHLIESGNAPRMIDVRTPGEFESAHIAGSYNVPLDLLREHRDEIRAHLADDVVLICRSGQRAGQAQETLRTAGLSNVGILEGGMTAWQAGDFPVNRGAQRWELDRQVRFVAGLIVAVSVLVAMVVPGFQWVAFVMGAGLAVAAATNTCLMGMMLARLPYNRGPRCDARSVVAALVAAAPGTRA